MGPYLTPFCLRRSLITESGIDLEKPRPDQKSVGFLVSPDGSCSMATKLKVQDYNSAGKTKRLMWGLKND